MAVTKKESEGEPVAAESVPGVTINVNVSGAGDATKAGARHSGTDNSELKTARTHIRKADQALASAGAPDPDPDEPQDDTPIWMAKGVPNYRPAHDPATRAQFVLNKFGKPGLPDYGAAKGIVDAPGLRGEADRCCSGCQYFQWMSSGVPFYSDAPQPPNKGICTKFDFATEQAWVCDAWEKYEPPAATVVIVEASEMTMDGKSAPAGHTDEAIVALGYGEPVKAIKRDGDLLEVGAYGILFGSPKERDLTGQWFSPKTDYGPRDGDGVAAMLNHGIPTRKGLEEFFDVTFKQPVKAKRDNVGVFVSHMIDMSDEYERAFGEMIEQGKAKFRWSSGTANHIARYDPVTGEIMRWHPVEFSYTPMAAEPRLPAIVPLKSLSTLTTPTPESGAPQAGSTGGESNTAAVAVKTVSQGESQMAGETPAVTAAPNAQPAAQAQTAPPNVADFGARITGIEGTLSEVKGFMQAINSSPAIARGGFATVGEEDKPKFKTLGEFLMSVARAEAHGVTDQRLVAIKSNDPNDESGFSLSKALGDGFVGSLYGAHMKAIKAPTGLSEGLSSGGGFLVGTDRMPGIMSRVYDVGQLLKLVNMIPISANSNGLTINAEDETSRATGSRRGGIRFYWTAEAGSKTASAPTFRQIEFRLRKAVGLVYATDELISDASALEAWIMTNLPEELAFGVEDSIINGLGGGMPEGVLASPALVSVAKETGQTATTIVTANLMKMWSRLWVRSRQNSIWIYNQDCQPQLDSLTIPVGTSGVEPRIVRYRDDGVMTIYGRPAMASEYCATLGTQGDILLLDLGEYQMIEKGGVQSASSIHVRFVNDESVFRFVYRTDGKPKWNSPLTPYKGSNTVSPFVAIDTRA